MEDLLTPCKCKTIVVYRDDVPYEMDILCKPCAEWEFKEAEETEELELPF